MDGFRDLTREYESMMSASTSGSSSGSPTEPTPESRNELSEILSKIRLSSSSFSASSSSSSSAGPKTRGRAAAKKEDSEVRLQRRALRIIAHETDRAANNIMLHIRYLSSPLRLWFKIQTLQLRTAAERQAFVAGIKISDRVRTELLTDWTAKDSFGLKILVKIARMSQSLFPTFPDHETFMRYMKPLYHRDSHTHLAITFYLYNQVMAPGPVYYAYDAAGRPTQQDSMEHEMHGWFDGFLGDFVEDLAAVGFDVEDAKKDLVRKLAFEMNTYASVAFKRPITVKSADGRRHRMDAGQLLGEIHAMLAGNPAVRILADQMTHWLAVDDPVAGPRVIQG